MKVELLKRIPGRLKAKVWWVEDHEMALVTTYVYRSVVMVESARFWVLPRRPISWGWWTHPEMHRYGAAAIAAHEEYNENHSQTSRSPARFM